MKPRRFATLAVALLLCTAVPALADTILLATGKTVSGRIVRKDGQSLRIKLDNGGVITIPASQVRKVTTAKAKDTATKRPAGPDTARDKPTVKKPAPKVTARKLSAERAARIKALISSLGSRDGENPQARRKEAREALVTIGTDAEDALCAALTDSQELRRMGVAMVLGRTRSKRAVRALLVAVYLGTPPKGKKAPWWERRYLKACGNAFKSITGSSFGYSPDKVVGGGAAERMLAWWGKNYEDYPLQWGEKLVRKKGEDEASRPDPLDEIKKMARRRYPKPASHARGTR